MSVLTTSTTSSRKWPIPPLNNGDHLDAAEFERRYEAMPEGVKAELIEGVVFMSPPVSNEFHDKPHMVLAGWLTYYIAKTPQLTLFGDNSTVRLGNKNRPQPDLHLSLPQHVGGKAVIVKGGYVSGPPALACEIAGSSVSFDLHEKKKMYARKGIREYLVWRTEESAIDWFSLEGDRYVPLSDAGDGTLRSKIFSGLWLHPASLLKADLVSIFKLLDESTSTPEHAAFVQRLTAQ